MSFRPSCVVALVVAAALISEAVQGQPVPTTNYENSGVVSEMIGSNAAGLTAYSSDFVARFRSEGAETRMKGVASRLKDQCRLSQPVVSRRLCTKERRSLLELLFAEGGKEQAKKKARRIREALCRCRSEAWSTRNLVNHLHGLLSGQHVDATGFAKAVRAYNRFVDERTPSFLTDPPPEILALRVVLTSLMTAATTEHPATVSSVALGEEGGSVEQLRLPRPEDVEGIVITPPLITPGTTIATPTAFGAHWGQIYGSLAYQPLSRYLTLREHDWKRGEWSDGTLSVGVGIGNPHRWIGLDVTVNIFDTFGVWSKNELGQERALSVKLHRALPHASAVAIGYENLWRNSPEEDEGGNSLYGVVTKVFEMRAQRRSSFSRVTLSVGIGNDRFLSESQFRRQESGINAFGSVGIRIWSFANVVADWTGQDLNLGVSVTPIPEFPLLLTPALVDVTGRAGDKVRFSIGAATTYDFQR